MPLVTTTLTMLVVVVLLLLIGAADLTAADAMMKCMC